jgi:hypothetical protein
VSQTNLDELTKRAKELVRANRYKISFHALYDNPQRNITAVDILQVLKEGAIKQLEPREVAGEIKYVGADRFRWLGEDAGKRILRLILVITENVVVVSAVEAGPTDQKSYLETQPEDSDHE